MKKFLSALILIISMTMVIFSGCSSPTANSGAQLIQFLNDHSKVILVQAVGGITNVNTNTREIATSWKGESVTIVLANDAKLTRQDIDENNAVTEVTVTINDLSSYIGKSVFINLIPQKDHWEGQSVIVVSSK